MEFQSVLVLEPTGHFKLYDKKEIAPFSHQLAEVTHQIGREWVRPWTLGVHKVVRLYKENKVHAVMLGVLVTLSSPLALPGALLRSVTLFFFQKQITLQPATAEPSIHKDGDFLSIMTWNAALGPGFMTEANDLEPSHLRIEGIVKKIDEEKADIVCLQEVFDLDAAEQLSMELREKGYDCLFNANPNAFGLPSGLFIAFLQTKNVKMHIEEVASWKFNNLQGIDALSLKGLLGVKLRLESEDRPPMLLNLFNTHLQSSYPDAGYGETRKEQIQSIAKTMRAWGSMDDLQEKPYSVLCGDFNFSNHPPEKSDKPDEYDDHMEVLQADQFNPLHILQQVKGEGTLHSPTESKGATVDYILLDHELKSKDLKARVIPLKEFESDHYPIITQVSLNCIPRNSTPF